MVKILHFFKGITGEKKTFSPVILFILKGRDLPPSEIFFSTVKRCSEYTCSCNVASSFVSRRSQTTPKSADASRPIIVKII